MARYAVKIGEIHLRSDKPITEKERKEAIARVCVAATGPNGEHIEVMFVASPLQP